MAVLCLLFQTSRSIQIKNKGQLDPSAASQLLPALVIVLQYNSLGWFYFSYKTEAVHISINYYLVHTIGVPIQYRFNVGPASQPIAGSMPVNHIRRWPNIVAELGDCPVFALTAIRVR